MQHVAEQTAQLKNLHFVTLDRCFGITEELKKGLMRQQHKAITEYGPGAWNTMTNRVVWSVVQAGFKTVRIRLSNELLSYHSTLRSVPQTKLI